MFPSKSQRLERRIKDLNALMAEYRKEMEEAEKGYQKRKLGKENAERTVRRCRSKIDSIGQKIREIRSELESLDE